MCARVRGVARVVVQQSSITKIVIIFYRDSVPKRVSRTKEGDTEKKKKQNQKERVQIQTTTVTHPDTPVSEALTSDINIDVSSASVSLDHDQSNTSMSTWSRGPGSDQWDILLDEAERFRLYLSKKKAVLNDKYGGFLDELSFPDDNLNFTLPESLSGIDRVSVSSQL